MSGKDYQKGKENPMESGGGDNSLLKGYEQAYGPVGGIPDSGRVIAQPTPILTIRPDLRQPRRAIPDVIRGEWDGDPNELVAVLANWHIACENRLGAEIPIVEILLAGAGERPEKASDPVVESYLSLLDLAASIKVEGLQNPITIAHKTIETGERRWLAYHLLNIYSGKDFSRIPAVEKQKIDVWAQAAENGARAPLNAVGMARQLALLIMDMYARDRGVSFDTYQNVVLPGECDRKFYAQVANGNAFQIKKGMTERVLSVTGLKSKAQISQFRALLSIPDALWMKADSQNWTEGAIRDYFETSKVLGKPDYARPFGESADTSEGERLTTVNRSGESEGGENALSTPPAASPAPHQWGTNVPPPRTTIGERRGLYDETPATAKGTRRQLERDDDEDASPDENDPTVQQELRGMEADLAGWDAEVETTVAIVAAPEWGDVALLLRYLKQIPGEDSKTLRLRATDLLTVSREDLRREIGRGSNMIQWWEELLEQTDKLVAAAAEAQTMALTRYLKHLWDVGQEMDERRRKARGD